MNNALLFSVTAPAPGKVGLRRAANDPTPASSITAMMKSLPCGG